MLFMSGSRWKLHQRISPPHPHFSSRHIPALNGVSIQGTRIVSKTAFDAMLNQCGSTSATRSSIDPLFMPSQTSTTDLLQTRLSNRKHRFLIDWQLWIPVDLIVKQAIHPLVFAMLLLRDQVAWPFKLLYHFSTLSFSFTLVVLLYYFIKSWRF